MEARHYEKLRDKELRCDLCPHTCRLKPGVSGICRVRTNTDGRLIADTYNKASSLAFDPIEKKPLYHFFPGKIIYSVGSVGCNLRCSFCQNCEISQTSVRDYPFLKKTDAGYIINQALNKPENIGIAFTYNEPSIWFEFMQDIATAAKSKGLKTVMISNGFINQHPLGELLTVIDAFNIDLKSFSEEFYKKQTGSKLDPVLQSLKTIADHNKHLEITNLIIPGLNDDKVKFTEMLVWIKDELGPDTPLHLSRYFPRYKMNIEPTSGSLMVELFEHAQQQLNYVFLGNMGGSFGAETYCPNCSKTVIARSGYFTKIPGLDGSGNCLYCGCGILKPDNF